MKKIIITITLFFLGLASFSQTLKFKKDMVLVDGKESLKVDESDPNNVSIYDLAGHEIIFLKFIHGRKFGSVYNQITFWDQKTSMTSRSYIFTKKLLLQKLLADGTLANGKIDATKLKRFIIKYDENVNARF